MAKESWVKDLFAEKAYHEVEGKRKLSFDKVHSLLELNDAADTSKKLETAQPHEAGRVAMTAQNALKGSAIKQGGLHVAKGDFRKAPTEWLEEVTPRAAKAKRESEAA